VPQLIGHTSFNYALRYLPATLVGVIGQTEPIGSAIFAIIVFQEVPSGLALVGSLVILVGVIGASISQSKK
jgi:drug/metabolite transporter (DMT)-like permease